MDLNHNVKQSKLDLVQHLKVILGLWLRCEEGNRVMSYGDENVLTHSIPRVSFISDWLMTSLY